MTASYTYWQDTKDGMWLGYWNEYPDHQTEGRTLDELKRMLVSLSVRTFRRWSRMA
ncbi:MAG: type II toxin-antitoxin system HicB family antitoxin [Kiritimatiellia bacterium]